MDERDRILDDRDMLELDICLLEDELRKLELCGITEGDPEYDEIEDEINTKTNEVMYLERCLADY